MLHHGGKLFGKSVNDHKFFAKTVLAIMFCCLYGRPSFLSKMFPIVNSKSKFVFDQASLFSLYVNCIENSNANVKAITCDSNKINLLFFKIS